MSDWLARELDSRARFSFHPRLLRAGFLVELSINMYADVGTHAIQTRFFAACQPAVEDPIFKLLQQFRLDQRPDKLDLGIGVYRNEYGGSPIFSSVKLAERMRLDVEAEKAYIGPAGDREYCDYIEALALGENYPEAHRDRLTTVQTPGGVGALRMAFELIAKVNPKATVWLSDPTWQVHDPIIAATGLNTARYPYYDRQTHSVAFEAMLSSLAEARPGDVLLLQGCCHNPTGCDLDLAQWSEIAALCHSKGLLPLVDQAYHGLGSSLEEDRAGLVLLAERLPELMVTYTCSKNFGLYRDRVGALMVVSANSRESAIVEKMLMATATELYFTPPAHGGAVVKKILRSPQLRELWQQELSEIRSRLKDVRCELFRRFEHQGVDFDVSYLVQQKGMFSLLQLTPQALNALREDHGIYIVDSRRINIAGLNPQNMEHFARAVTAVGG